MAIAFQNVPALVRRMEQLREDMVKKAARKAVRAGAQVIAEAMVERAPVQKAKTKGSNALDPGELKADIKVRNVPDDAGEVAATAGPGHKTAHAARWVEWGHRDVHGGSSRVVDGKGRTRGPGKASAQDVPPHPFLRPAFEESVQEAEAKRDAVLREVWEGGKRV